MPGVVSELKHWTGFLEFTFLSLMTASMGLGRSSQPLLFHLRMLRLSPGEKSEW